MRFGFYTNLIATDPARLGLEYLARGRELGFDYVELPLAQFAALDEGAFESALRQVQESGLRCEACNNFLLQSVRVTGPGVDVADAERYVIMALGRAARLGARVVVFGSPWSRNVPPGFSGDEAWRQLVAFLRLVDPIATGHDICRRRMIRPDGSQAQRGFSVPRHRRRPDRPTSGTR